MTSRESSSKLDFSQIKFDERGLVPVVVQDTDGRVLMLAYMNEEALRLTVQTGYAHYFSRSRNRIWKKGETSGHVQKVKDVILDCDGDAILIRVEQVGVACHTGEYSCFHRPLNFSKDEVLTFPSPKPPADVYSTTPAILEELYSLIEKRKAEMPEDSYTTSLFKKGASKIAKKVGEEATEVVVAYLSQSEEDVVYETADLIYHLWVLLAHRNIKPSAIYAELFRRYRKRHEK